MLIASREFAPGLSRYLLAWLHWLPSSGHAIARIRVSSPKISRKTRDTRTFLFYEMFSQPFSVRLRLKDSDFFFIRQEWQRKRKNNKKNTLGYEREI